MSKVYQEISRALTAIDNCSKSDNEDWLFRWTSRVENLVADVMPSGSGIDTGTKIDLDNSNPERLVFTMSFHHMDEFGGYNGWTDHSIYVRPSLANGFDLRITGRDRNQIKDYLYEVYQSALSADFTEWRE